MQIDLSPRGRFAKAPLFAVLAILATACDPARSEPVQQPGAWETLADDEDHLAQALRKPLSKAGANVHTQLKITPPQPETTPGNRAFAYYVHDRTIDCGTGAFTTDSIIYYAADGSVVEEHFEGRKLGPMQDGPGSRGAYYTLSMCELAGFTAPVLPYISLLDVKAGDWRAMGVDDDGAKVSVDPSSVRRVDGAATITVRSEYPRPQPLGDGRDYATLVDAAYFVCDSTLISVGSSDYYGANGKLLASEAYDVEKVARRAPPLEVTERIRELACVGPLPPPRPVRSARAG